MEKLGEFRESLKSTDWAWIAGYLDGEGCFMLRKAYLKNKNYKKTKVGLPGWYYYSPRLTLVNTDRESVDFVAKVFGSPVIKRKLTSSNLRPCFYVEISAIRTLRSILKQLLPYLKVKYKQAECLYRFTSTPRPGGLNRDKITKQREKLYKEFRVIAEECGQADAGRPERFHEKIISKLKKKALLKSVTLSQAIG